MKPYKESDIVIVGAARNVARTVARQLGVFERAFASFRSRAYVIVESDSSDRTLEILAEWKRAKGNLHVISLGNLEPSFPNRMHRLFKARSAAWEFCRDSPALASADYFAVADWDGVNLQVTAEGVESCWRIPDWDVVTANQPEGYYDVWTLRHPTWCPDDCLENYRRIEAELGGAAAYQIALGSKRISIPESEGPIEVESAFGGLAIYRKEVFFESRYTLPAPGEPDICEHVPFHAGMRKQGARIVINPALVNMRSYYDLLPLSSWPRVKHNLRRVARKLLGGSR